MSLSGRERAEGFLRNCYCGKDERERVEGFLPVSVSVAHTGRPVLN